MGDGGVEDVENDDDEREHTGEGGYTSRGFRRADGSSAGRGESAGWGDTAWVTARLATRLGRRNAHGRLLVGSRGWARTPPKRTRPGSRKAYPPAISLLVVTTVKHMSPVQFSSICACAWRPPSRTTHAHAHNGSIGPSSFLYPDVCQYDWDRRKVAPRVGTPLRHY